jgi:hypothetical protein
VNVPRCALLLMLLVTVTTACGRDKPDWRVHALLGGTSGYTAVQQATAADAWMLHPESLAPDDRRARLGAFAVAGKPVPLSDQDRSELSALVLSPGTYDWARVKKMNWTPRVGVRFANEADRVDVVFCMDSDQVLVFRGPEFVLNEDTDAARPQLVALLKRLFPDEPYVQALSPAIAD